MLGRSLFWLSGFVMLINSVACTQRKSIDVKDEIFSGSESCIQCHERFYELWSPSFHGKAMQPINAKFVDEENLPESEEFSLEGKTYNVAFEDTLMLMYEKNGDSLKKYDVVWALGGKNVFYFLTPMEKGKLQTIPLAYDVNRETWYNNPESAVRHFGEGITDEALPWKDRMYTFNSSCYSCHVSQLNTNFSLANDSYETTWKEAGINCETCHGPSGEHVRIFQNAKEGEVFEDIGLIVTKTFTKEQHNSSCAPCHAKMSPITPSYMPGDPYFDNYDLTTLENPDFYPDGRDLGENYTFTTWKQNECVASSELHCVTCHTSSGRDRFADNPNDACVSCHKTRVENVVAHSGHKEGSEGAVCVNCHMPKTEFGRMIRSDHSFRPPMPEATIKFNSPNACNICHDDKSPEWANKIVKQRQNSNYQEETLRWAQLIREARASDWTNLDKMLQIVNENKLNEVVVTSFIRLFANCTDEKKWETVINALNNESTLVRAAAAAALTGNFSEQAKNALVKVCDDEFRLVRISAAISLAGFSPDQFSATDAQLITKVTEEYMHSMVTRPDDWSSHYNLGIFHQNQGDAVKALESYEIAARLYPEALMPLINSSVLYSYIGNPAKAEENLKKAVAVDPENEAANLNLGLLLAEQGKMAEAEQALKRAIKANPEQAVAAYNLSVITAQRNITEAVEYAKMAAEASPEDPKYAYTLAFYQLENGQKNEAIKTLKGILKDNPLYLSAVSFLADIYIKDGKKQEAILLYQKALNTEGISEQDKLGIQQAILSIQQVM
ncbi:MAG: ammonia-forming cytochrome c nitrite reductase subunit c552 [Prolixibacteraceae bacterium]|jgi:tetratricopeptide (TPR) repeat protein|nr:ammonia-forming cytochrome c nitrite reductase subunit c552 [Prolixibacteraceae bacterium]MBT6006101.1 ammonia-forming cytochrome c nitrite reductase subunit c552 [Prolixibacteraceae bacterium]MBT6999443.1 ammonia-forming cytochrome c nitrite reductase subunit c552 [Prolixibacteraceae bacterium]MBT7394790.1 ammonia-forming cytochrome c nitrite reductase subunit c552 [Prolixibacteraceae bacterium]